MPSSRSPTDPARPDPPGRNDGQRGDADGPALLRTLRRSLTHAVTALDQTWEECPFTTERVDPTVGDAQPRPGRVAVQAQRGPQRARDRAQTYRVDGPGSYSVRVHVSTSHSPEEGFVRVCVGLEDGPTVRYTVRHPAPSAGDARPSEPPLRPDPVAALGRKVTAFLFRELKHRLEALVPPSSSPSAPSPMIARLALTREGEISGLTPRARALLGYGEQETVDPNFFAHVDGHNLRRVMCDLAEMVEGQKQRARWLLRLRGRGTRWHWYRAAAQNNLDARGAIDVTLRPLSPAAHGDAS